MLIKETPEKIFGLLSDFHSAKEGCHAVTHSSLYLLIGWDDSLNPYGNTQCPSQRRNTNRSMKAIAVHPEVTLANHHDHPAIPCRNHPLLHAIYQNIPLMRLPPPRTLPCIAPYAPGADSKPQRDNPLLGKLRFRSPARPERYFSAILVKAESAPVSS